MKLTTPNATTIRKALNAQLKPLRCKLINGRLFITVREDDKNKAQSLCAELNLTHASGTIIASTSYGVTDFPNLLQAV